MAKVSKPSGARLLLCSSVVHRQQEARQGRLNDKIRNKHESFCCICSSCSQDAVVVAF